MPPAIWYPLQLDKIITETEFTRRFIFHIDSDGLFEYEAGQFLTCDLPIGEKRAQRWRSYSIANWNPGNQEIEFCISYKEGGPASEYFFKNISIGDQFKCKGPEGTFILPDQTSQNLILICTGTGLAPFRSMIQKIIKQKITFDSIQLIYGTRTLKDIIYKSELLQWPQDVLNLNTHICLSRESNLVEFNSPSVFVHPGYVHPVYKTMLQNNLIDSANSNFLICGWSAMIDEAVLNLFSEYKIPRERIRFELYG